MSLLTIEDSIKYCSWSGGQIIRPFVSRTQEVANKLRDTLAKLCELALLFKFVLQAGDIIHTGCRAGIACFHTMSRTRSKMSVSARDVCCPICLFVLFVLLMPVICQLIISCGWVGCLTDDICGAN